MPATCSNSQPQIMVRKSGTTIETTPFGAWLKMSRQERGLTLEALADRAETAQPVLTYLETGKRNPTRKMIARLARGLMPENADEDSYRRLLSAGMRAHGFMPEEMMEDEYPEEFLALLSKTREYSPEARQWLFERWKKDMQTVGDMERDQQSAHEAGKAFLDTREKRAKEE